MPRWVSVFGALLCAVGLTLTAGCPTTDAPMNGGDNQQDADVGDGDADTENDTTEDANDDQDTDTLCSPAELRCLGETTVQQCDEDGAAFEDIETCGEDEICEDGQCIDEPDCEGDETRCEDSTTVLSCTATGNWGPPQDCSSDQACHDGACVDGATTGSVCDGDGECAGGSCRCGDDESCALDIGGYCTADCSTTSCTSGEICWRSEGIEIADYDHCLAACGSGCNLDACHPVLTEDGDGYAWEDACLPEGLKQIGEQCNSDAECASESCYDDHFDFGFCTRLCEEGGCPGEMACVRHGSDDDYRCYDECDTDSDCPDGWNIGCSGLRDKPDGDTARVCASS